MSSRYESIFIYYVIPELQQRNVVSGVVWMQLGTVPHVEYSINILVTELSPAVHVPMVVTVTRFHSNEFLVVDIPVIQNVLIKYANFVCEIDHHKWSSSLHG
ncbi:hypothetical protein NPIL_225841 [Nephila pilipes]|uniref:Uncharacterized protein n=1 Tax=Nephila pilipes TaxID=299642 RepID=A0A8X6QLR3_NEPPI|nr:hypothetical protein NPIL_225841 [Nephila pilipes]